MSFEDNLIRRFDAGKKQETDSAIEFKRLLPEAHERAKKVIADCQIQETAFSNLYEKDEISRNLRYVQDRQRRFGPEDENRKYARILEAILLEQVELSNWFGENATTIKTSDFDDIRNGVDMIVRYGSSEVTMPANFLGLGVDVTFSPKGTEEKLEEIFSGVYDGKLSQIKYFLSEEDDFRGERSNVPLIVLGIEKATLEKIGILWAKKDNKALAIHPAQHMLLSQAQMQLSAMRGMAQKRGHANIIRSISGPLSIIQTELTKKGPVALFPDRTWDAMQRSLERYAA